MNQYAGTMVMLTWVLSFCKTDDCVPLILYGTAAESCVDVDGGTGLLAVAPWRGNANGAQSERAAVLAGSGMHARAAVSGDLRD